MITFKSHSGIYTLEANQLLKSNLKKAWELLSDPGNLEKITPPEMKFTVTGGGNEPMYPGQIISYKVSPFPGMRSNWITEITHVRDMEYFVDEQRFGPYKMWHHEHRIIEHEKGVVMKDRISYKLPFGFLGKIVHPLIVKPQLRKIFQHREKILNEMFNK